MMEHSSLTILYNEPTPHREMSALQAQRWRRGGSHFALWDVTCSDLRKEFVKTSLHWQRLP